MDKWLRNNNVVKVIALLIGILLWVVVHLDSQSPTAGAGTALKEEKIYNVAVTPKYDSSLYTIKSIDPAEVTVSVRWKDTVLRRVNTSSLQVEADLNNVTAGTHTVILRPLGVSGSAAADVIPQTVRVVIEKKEKKEVPVTITVTGTPLDGYKAGQPVIKPGRVQVTVPESLLDGVDSARAEISVDKASATVSKQVKLTAYSKDGKPVDGTVNPQVVDVDVPVTSPFKLMPLQVKLNGQPAAGFSVASVVQRPEQVTVYAAQDILDRMDFYEGPQFDLSSLRESRQATLDIPLKNRATQTDPTKVSLQVEIVPSATKAFDKVPVTLLGQNNDFTARLVSPDPGTINLTLEGAPALLDKLRPQDIQAVADVGNLAPGRHDVLINLNLPIFIKKPGQTYRATVEITAKPGGSAAPAGDAGVGATPTPTPSPTGTPTAGSPAVTASPTEGSPTATASPAAGSPAASPAPAAGSAAP